MSLLQEKSGERRVRKRKREERECGNPTSATSGRSLQLARAQEATPRADAGVQTNKIKEAVKDSADAWEKSSGECGGKHSSQRWRARGKVLIRLGELVVRGQLSRAHFTHDLTEKVSPS